MQVVAQRSGVSITVCGRETHAVTADIGIRVADAIPTLELLRIRIRASGAAYKLHWVDGAVAGINVELTQLVIGRASHRITRDHTETGRKGFGLVI